MNHTIKWNFVFNISEPDGSDSGSISLKMIRVENDLEDQAEETKGYCDADDLQGLMLDMMMANAEAYGGRNENRF